MWKSFVAKNFRCFGSLLLQPLERVNLIAGKNNTGKTTLLEAMYLHTRPQDCELPFRISEFRGGDNLNKLSEELASWLFYDRHGATGFEFSTQDDQGRTRFLKVWLVDGMAARQQHPEAEKAIVGSFIEDVWNANRPWIILKTEAQGTESYSVGVLTGHGLASVSSKVPWGGQSVFLTCGRRPAEEDAKAFSELDASNRLGEILTSLCLLEPRLRRLSLLMLAGAPVIHGDIGLGRMVPLSLMGEGIGRFLSILLAIAAAPGGVVLIDEVENGLHYSVMKDVWKAIAHAARQADVQVFATSHSYQCIESAHEAFTSDGTYDLRLHRLDRIDDKIQVVTYDQDTLAAAMKFYMEVR